MTLQFATAMKSLLTSPLRSFAYYFSFEGRRLGKVNMPPKAIAMADASTVTSRHSPYRESPRKSRLISDGMRVLRDLDTIEEVSGFAASPVVMVLQKGKYRFVLTFVASIASLLWTDIRFPARFGVCGIIWRSVFLDHEC